MALQMSERRRRHRRLSDYATIKTTLGADRQSGELRHAAERARCKAPAVSPPRISLVAANPGARTAGAQSRERRGVVPLHHGGDARHAARARPHHLQPGRTGSGDRGQCRLGDSAEQHQRRAAVHTPARASARSPCLTTRAIPTTAGAGRHQHRLRRTAQGMDAPPPRRPRRSRIRRTNATSRASIRFRRCSASKQIPLLVTRAERQRRRRRRRSSPPPAGRW